MQETIRFARVKICDLTQFYSPRSGGVRRYVHEKIAHIQREGGHAHVLIVPGERDAVTAGERSTVYTIRSPLVSRTAQYRALLRLGRVAEILEYERPDIIESADPYQLGWTALACGRELRIPVVAFYHSHFAEAYVSGIASRLGGAVAGLAMDGARRYTADLYSRFARTLVPSPALAAELRAWGVGNTTPVDLGVDTDIFCPTPDDALATRAELGIPQDCVLLLYVGRLAPEKNTRTLFSAFEMLVREQPGRFHLLAVGDGPQRDFLQTLSETTRAVTWREYCAEPAALARLYRAADIFTHPGVRETFGLAALESQACGTPVAGIRGTRLDRIIFSGLDLWAHGNTPPALAGAVEKMSRAEPAALGAQAAREVAARFPWTVVFNRLFAVYRDVLSTYKPGC